MGVEGIRPNLKGCSGLRRWAERWLGPGREEISEVGRVVDYRFNNFLDLCNGGFTCRWSGCWCRGIECRKIQRVNGRIGVGEIRLHWEKRRFTLIFGCRLFDTVRGVLNSKRRLAIQVRGFNPGCHVLSGGN